MSHYKMKAPFKAEDLTPDERKLLRTIVLHCVRAQGLAAAAGKGERATVAAYIGLIEKGIVRLMAEGEGEAYWLEPNWDAA